jgi:hypothetical protein
VAAAWGSGDTGTAVRDMIIASFSITDLNGEERGARWGYWLCLDAQIPVGGSWKVADCDFLCRKI